MVVLLGVRAAVVELEQLMGLRVSRGQGRVVGDV
jgi:hypothetical protein